MKKFVSAWIMLAFLLSFSLTAFANPGGGPPPPGYPQDYYNNQLDSVDETEAPTEAPTEKPTEIYYGPYLLNNNDASIEGTEAAQDDDRLDAIGTKKSKKSDKKDSDDKSTDKKKKKTEQATSEPTSANKTEATQPETVKPTLNQPDVPPEPSDPTMLIIFIVGGAALLVLLILIIALVHRKRNPGAGRLHPHGGMRGLPLRIEILSGMCYNANLDFTLHRNLTIGTGKDCDLVFDDPQILEMHAVITLDEDIVTIRECSDTLNTYVGGMKIFAPNRLRPDDIVTIGSTSFQVFFDS